MNALATFYPELDGRELAEIIAPLDRHDDEVMAVLAGERSVRESLQGPVNGRSDAIRDWLAAAEEYPFQRIVRQACAQLVDDALIASIEEVALDRDAIAGQVLARAEAQLKPVFMRPLVAAVNNGRRHGSLRGETPEEQYRYFVDESLRTSFQAVGRLTFPVLSQIAGRVVSNERESAKELFTRLASDRTEIANLFGIEPADRIVSIGADDGDTHNRGRRVSVLLFESGRRLVYKPRDVSCEAAYAGLSAEVNRRVGTSLASAATLRRSGYGYVEYVPREDVTDLSAEFMRASGALTALLYLLNARDMHLENIVRTRRGPIPIDLETILHPSRIHVGPTPIAAGNAFTAMESSVYGIGILPLVMAGKDGGSGHVDLGFLGGQGVGNSPFKLIQFEKPFTSEISLALRAVPAAPRETVLTDLSEATVRRLGRHLADGFIPVLRAVLADRDWWTRALRRHATGLRIRYVHNPTVLYGQMLRMTSSAKALDDERTYLALMKRVAIASKDSDPAIVRSELRQLAERDIPYFVVASDGTKLMDGQGNEVGAELPVAPLDRALARASELSERDLTEQLRLIYLAFIGRFPDDHLAPADATAAPGAPRAGAAGRPPQRDGITAIVRELSDHLVATSLPDRYAHLPRTWVGTVVSADPDQPWPPGVLGYDLYTGRTGPALALAAAARVLDEPRYRDLAAQIFETTADILLTNRYELRSVHAAGIGAYDGLAGSLFALAAAGRLLDEPDWVRAAQQVVPLVVDQIEQERAENLAVDVIGGVAGVLSCLVAIGGPAARTAIPGLVTTLTTALQAPGRRAQSTLVQSGLAHGVSGLICALADAWPYLPAAQRTVVQPVTTALVTALSAFYDEAERDWITSSTGRFATGWCHGVGGIAVALSRHHQVFGGEEVARSLRIATDNVLRAFGRNLTWCHGDLGNHDIVRALAGDGDETLAAELRAVESNWLIPEVISRKLADTDSRYAHTNSVMVGSSGVVLHLASRLDPAVRVSPVRLTLGGDK